VDALAELPPLASRIARDFGLDVAAPGGLVALALR
jgi:hypothetical protein